MRAKLEHARGDNPGSKRRRNLDHEPARRRVLFVEDCLELRVLNRLLGDRALKCVQLLTRG